MARRSGQLNEQRARTLSAARYSRRELDALRILNAQTRRSLPMVRGECVDGPRPCPHVSCSYHLYLDVSPLTGSIKLNFPDLDVWELANSCALDVADAGGATLDDVGAMMNITRERVRQIEVIALDRIAPFVPRDD